MGKDLAILPSSAWKTRVMSARLCRCVIWDINTRITGNRFDRYREKTKMRELTIRFPELLDGELRETQTANYFSDVYPIDCTVSPANALFCRKNGTLLQAGNLL